MTSDMTYLEMIPQEFFVIVWLISIAFVAVGIWLLLDKHLLKRKQGEDA